MEIITIKKLAVSIPCIWNQHNKGNFLKCDIVICNNFQNLKHFKILYCVALTNKSHFDHNIIAKIRDVNKIVIIFIFISSLDLVSTQ